MPHELDPEAVDVDLEADLVEYLVVEVPDQSALAAVAPALHALTASSTIRILDLAAVMIDAQGGAHELDLETIDELASLASFRDAHGSLLSVSDVRLAALALAPGTAGIVVVTEDRWAAPLAHAARRAGGCLVAGERIPAHRVERALLDASPQRNETPR